MYIPILKSKAAELGAISALDQKRSDSIMPLFEVVAPTKISKKGVNLGNKTIIEEFLSVTALELPKSLWNSWDESRPFYIDFSLLPFAADEILKAAHLVLTNCADGLRLQPVPVITLQTAKPVTDYLLEFSSKLNAGICIRVTPFDLKDVAVLNGFIANTASQISLDSINLMLDYKNLPDDEMQYSQCLKRLSQITNIGTFRRVIVSGSAFPKDMAQYSMEAVDNHKDRTEWILWQKYGSLVGRDDIIFSDYTIRHPIYDAAALFYSSSATIKYTVDDRWNIYRGQKNQYKQYPGNAVLLIGDKIDGKDVFYGQDFCAGDKYIYEKSQEATKGDKSKPGNTTQWLEACMNHHMSVAVDQIANLPSRE